MGIVACCRNLLKKYSAHHRAVLCKNWVTPIRIIAVTSLFGHLLWRLVVPTQFYSFFLILIHVVAALILLAECRRAERYHKTIEEFERREAVLRDNPP